MEEIEKRFAIIRAAIDLSDYETIDTQIGRLSNISTDEHLHTILQDLENKNFHSALYAMSNYSVSTKDDFFESKPHHAEVTQEVPETETDLFSLAMADRADTEEHIVSVDDMLEMTKESVKAPRAYEQSSPPAPQERVVHEDPVPPKVVETPVPPRVVETPTAPKEVETPTPEDDPLFTLDQVWEPDEESESVTTAPEDTLVEDEEALDYLSQESESMFSMSEEDLVPQEEIENIEEEPDTGEEPDTQDYLSQESETMFSMPEVDTVANEEIESTKEEIDTFVPDAIEDEFSLDNTLPEEEPPAPRTVAPTDTIAKAVIQEDRPLGDKPLRLSQWDNEHDEDEKVYSSFAYMGQKFRNMLHQYPQLEELETGTSDEANHFIDVVSIRDYTEVEVESAISRYQELKSQGRIAEAAQMLIAAATTESPFAQFMLARELFHGDILTQDYAEAFTQINKLAEEDFPEAICDLGQLYESGIGIDKNKHHAMLLYEEAAEMGIERAKRHYERLKNSNPLQSIKSSISTLLNKKGG